MARSPLLQHEHHGVLPADIRDLLQKGEGGLQLCVHDQDHQEGLVSGVCVHEVDQDHQEGLVSAVCA